MNVSGEEGQSTESTLKKKPTSSADVGGGVAEEAGYLTDEDYELDEEGFYEQVFLLLFSLVLSSSPTLLTWVLLQRSRSKTWILTKRPSYIHIPARVGIDF